MRTRLPHVVMLTLLVSQLGANYQTRNFWVTAETPELAREIALAAEGFRRSLAAEWLGRELPDWRRPCPIHAQVHPQMPPNGLTTFGFHRGQTYGWRIEVQGSRASVLQNVLPHEITHAIFATHFGRPLPRWADEGVSIQVEDAAARGEQDQKLIEYLNAGRTIPLSRLFTLNDYPDDILPLYSQGYSVVSFLIARGGRQRFVAYISEGMRSNDWNGCTKRHYDYETLGHLQRGWMEWVATSAVPSPSAVVQNVALRSE